MDLLRILFEFAPQHTPTAETHREFHEALMRQDFPSCVSMLRRGEKLCFAHANSRNCYELAYYVGGWELLLQFIKIAPEGAKKSVGGQGENLLFVVENLSEFKYLLFKMNLDPNVVSSIEGNALTYLFSKNMADFPIVQYLLKRNVDVNIRDHRQMTPYNYAIKYNNDEKIIKLLLEAGAETIDYEGDNLLMQILKNTPLYRQGCSHDNVYELIDNGFNLKFKNKSNQTVLMYAAQFSWDVMLLQKLVEKGAEANVADCTDKNVLYYALQGNFNCAQKLIKLQYLLSIGVDHALVDTEGCNLLIHAVRMHELDQYFQDLFKKIIDLPGIDFYAEDCSKCTVISHFITNLIMSFTGETSGLVFVRNCQVLKTLVKMADDANITSLNCKYDMHPTYMMIRFLTPLAVKDQIFNLNLMIEPIITASFKDVNMSYNRQSCSCAMFHNYRQCYPVHATGAKCKVKEFHYNTITAIMSCYLRMSQDPTEMLLVALDAGYKVKDEDKQLISPINHLMHLVCEGVEVQKDLVMCLLKVFIEREAPVCQTFLEFEDDVMERWSKMLDLFDALYLAAYSGSVECVAELLPYWAAPSLSLLLFIADKKVAEDLFPVLAESGPLPCGFEGFPRIQTLLHGTSVYDRFMSLHDSTPHTLLDYSRGVIRRCLKSSESDTDLAANVNQLEVPPLLHQYLLYNNQGGCSVTTLPQQQLVIYYLINYQLLLKSYRFHITEYPP